MKTFHVLDSNYGPAKNDPAYEVDDLTFAGIMLRLGLPLTVPGGMEAGEFRSVVNAPTHSQSGNAPKIQDAVVAMQQWNGGSVVWVDSQ